jgi:hypothetical protein
VNETDLHARHRWLVAQTDFRERMLTDPDYFDVKIAGWWVWGISMWIGSGWCSRPDRAGRGNASRAGRGIQANVEVKRPMTYKGGAGVHRQLPDISGDGNASGRGIFSKTVGGGKRQQIKRGGNGVHQSVQEVRPHLQRGGQGVTQEAIGPLAAYFEALAARLRRVRVCCGEWDRILGPSPTTKIGLTGVFLDPPYDMRIVQDRAGSDGNAPTDVLYNEHDNELSKKVVAWAIEHQNDPLLRIAVCGYEGEHVFPSSWECVPWKANGGYGNQSGTTKGKENAGRERIWFSPHCLKPGLFSLNEAGEMLAR